MAEHYLIPAGETRVEITVVNSRFIATAAPVFSVEEARAFVARSLTGGARASAIFWLGSHCMSRYSR